MAAFMLQFYLLPLVLVLELIIKVIMVKLILTEIYNFGASRSKKSLFVPEIEPFEVGIVVRPNCTM